MNKTSSSVVRCLLVAVLVSVAGCGSKLKVSEIDSVDEQSDGIVVNKRTEYSATITPVDMIFCGPSKSCYPQGDGFSGVSMNKMLSVDASRMPFASATLSIETRADQTLKKVGIVSGSGTSRAVEAATKLSDAETERRKLRREAREAENKAQSEAGS